MTRRTSTLMELCWLLLLTGSACIATARLDTPLKTEAQADPYAQDGLSFRSLCYHDVRDGLRATLREWPESTAMDTYDLIQQFQWIRENDYHVVSLDAILAARSGGPKLPPRALLLTFDDGYRSMYTRVFPLLRLFNYPAVIGLVGEWLQEESDGRVFYGDHRVPRERFVTWPQVREMAASGLVEVASHSYRLHQGVLGNPQGGMPPSAVTRINDPSGWRYESDAVYLARLRADLARNSELIASQTGHRPRVMIWPYGAYNMLGVKAAAAEGMPITMTLDAGPNTPAQPLARVRRALAFYNDKVTDLKWSLTHQAAYDGGELPLSRVVGVDLDSLYDPDPKRQEQNVGALIERIHRLRVKTVYLRAVADADGDGLAEAAYFPNRHLPLRSDLFSRVSWQLRNRAGFPPEVFEVYAWLPVLAFKLPDHHPAAAELAAAAREARTGALPSARVRKIIQEIYADAGTNAPRIFGLLLGAGAAPDGSATEGLPSSTAQAEELYRFTLELAAVFRESHPNALLARMLTPSAQLDHGVGGFAPGSYAATIRQFDFAALALPAAELEPAGPWLDKFIERVAHQPGALRSTVFILPTMAQRRPLPSEDLAAELQRLQRRGVRNFGYYPDLGGLDHPAFATVRPSISLAVNPGRPL